MLSKLDQIKGNKNKVWFNELNRMTLNLLQQYTVMAVNLNDMNIYLVLLQNILRIIQTCSFNNFFFILRNRLAIRQFVGNLFNIDLLVDIDYYPNLSKPVILPSTSLSLSWNTTLFPTICAYSEFVSTAKKMKQIALQQYLRRKISLQRILLRRQQS